MLKGARSSPRNLPEWRAWCFSRPERPTDSSFIAAFDSRVRDGCLNESRFLSLEDAREKLESWRRHHSTDRPHGALGNLAPEEFRSSSHGRGRMTSKSRIPPGTKNGVGLPVSRLAQ